jgi:hypothetical protein
MFDITPAEISVTVITSNVVAVSVSMAFSCDVYFVLINGLADTCLIPATMY